MRRIGQVVSRWTGHPAGLFVAIALSLAGWRFLGMERTVLLVSLLTWWQLFPLQAAANRAEAEILAHLREQSEDLPEVDERRAAERAHEER
jgi:hypothetical protein